MYQKQDKKLTGRIRFRMTRWRQKLIAQVEWQDTFHTHLYAWKDATLADLQEVGIREAIAAGVVQFAV